MKIRVSKPTEEDIQYIAENMRGADKKEIWLADRSRPYAALKYCVQLSDKAYVLRADDKPVFIFGVEREGLSDVGKVWMLSTDKINDVKCEVAFLSKKYVLLLTKGFDKVYNYVYCENKISLKWLEWLGFEISEKQPFGADAAMFHRVERKGE